MRGKWKLTDAEKELVVTRLKTAIEYLSNNQREIYKLVKYDIAPCHVDDILQSLGWNRDDHDINGWECDCWYYYSHKDYDFTLVMFYTGFTFDLELYRGDIDD